MSSTSSVALIAAALQLKLVESVLRAIQAPNPLAPGGSLGKSEHCCDQFCPGTLRPEPRYLPRHVIVPTPRYLPRHVIQPTPRIEVDCLPRTESKAPNITPGPVPPWKVLPWQEPAQPANVIKIIIRQPDMVGKGNLIDLFM
ncbi:MAG TPA: hypothetical protein VGG44_01080 [Tepidisphaeraceae bacterium]